MAIVYIGLGANLGDCRENLLQAWAKLGGVNDVNLLTLSNPYMSEPIGMESENWFINAVGSLETSLEPFELLREMFVVEKRLGRERVLDGIPEDRCLDLDLLYWDDMVSDDPRVTLPHPEIANRLFVLRPLAEIEPELSHPVTQRTSTEMMQDLLKKDQETGQGSKVILTSWSNPKGEVSV